MPTINMHFLQIAQSPCPLSTSLNSSSRTVLSPLTTPSSCANVAPEFDHNHPDHDSYNYADHCKPVATLRGPTDGVGQHEEEQEDHPGQSHLDQSVYFLHWIPPSLKADDSNPNRPPESLFGDWFQLLKPWLKKYTDTDHHHKRYRSLLRHNPPTANYLRQ